MRWPIRKKRDVAGGLESLHQLYKMLELMDREADHEIMVQMSSTLWRDMMRPHIKKVREILDD